MPKIVPGRCDRLQFAYQDDDGVTRWAPPFTYPVVPEGKASRIDAQGGEWLVDADPTDAEVMREILENSDGER